MNKTIFRTISMMTVVISTCANISFAGTEGRGGGDTVSKRAREIINDLNTDRYRTLAKNISSGIALAEDATTTQHHKIRSLVQQGLLEDIADPKTKAPYVISEHCYEDINGVREERAASTFMGVLGSDICVSVRRLAHSGATDEAIVGLLVHEHARHFNEADTQDGIVHPLAMLVESAVKYRLHRLEEDVIRSRTANFISLNYNIGGPLGPVVQLTQGQPLWLKMEYAPSPGAFDAQCLILVEGAYMPEKGRYQVMKFGEKYRMEFSDTKLSLVAGFNKKGVKKPNGQPFLGGRSNLEKALLANTGKRCSFVVTGTDVDDTVVFRDFLSAGIGVDTIAFPDVRDWELKIYKP